MTDTTPKIIDYHLGRPTLDDAGSTIRTFHYTIDLGPDGTLDDAEALAKRHVVDPCGDGSSVLNDDSGICGWEARIIHRPSNLAGVTVDVITITNPTPGLEVK